MLITLCGGISHGVSKAQQQEVESARPNSDGNLLQGRWHAAW